MQDDFSWQSCKLNCQVFDKERQLLGLSQFFEVNDMQDDFLWRSPRVSGAAKDK
jgi:hypothetical protein